MADGKKSFILYCDQRGIFNKLSDEQARVLRARKDEATKIELRQFRYIYWLNQRYKKECKLKEQPYLKHYVEKPNNFEKVEAGGAILNFSSTEMSNGNET